MYLQKVLSKKNFVAVMKVTDGSGSVTKYHGSGTLLERQDLEFTILDPEH
jgi:hypothetical protein